MFRRHPRSEKEKTFFRYFGRKDKKSFLPPETVNRIVVRINDIAVYKNHTVVCTNLIAI